MRLVEGNWPIRGRRVWWRALSHEVSLHDVHVFERLDGLEHPSGKDPSSGTVDESIKCRGLGHTHDGDGTGMLIVRR